MECAAVRTPSPHGVTTRHALFSRSTRLFRLFRFRPRPLSIETFIHTTSPFTHRYRSAIHRQSMEARQEHARRTPSTSCKLSWYKQGEPPTTTSKDTRSRTGTRDTLTQASTHHPTAHVPRSRARTPLRNARLHPQVGPRTPHTAISGLPALARR